MNTVTIIIPHRDRVATLRRLLDSIYYQTSEIDVVVVDDHSKDTSKAIQLSSDFSSAKIIENTGDANAGAARNCGLEHTTTKWVLFADSDDYFLPDSLQYLLQTLKFVPSNVDLIYFSVTSKNEISGKPGRRHVATCDCLQHSVDANDDLLLRYASPGPCAKLIRRSLLERHNIRFDSIPASNDVVFSQLCGHFAREVAVCRLDLYCITESGDSLTANLTPERALSRLEALNRANGNVLNWKVKIRMDYGITWLLASRPWDGMARKYRTYLKWAHICCRRVSRCFSKYRIIRGKGVRVFDSRGILEK